MKNNYKVIVFDLGNVLISFDYNIILNRLDEIEKGLGSKFYNLYSNNYDVHKKYEKWELSDQEFTAIMLKWLDNKVTAEEFYHIYSDIFTANNEMISLLPKLKQKYKLVLLSNTNYIHQKYGWEKYNFFHHFDKLILSHEAGAVKPEPKIYKAVEDFTGEEPAAHFFTDDIKEYVEGAKKMGWNALQFTGYSEFLNALSYNEII